MPLFITSSSDGATISLHVAGDIDLATQQRLAQAIDSAIRADGVEHIVVDLADTEFMDCYGMSALIRGRRRADDAGRALNAVGATGTVQIVLELTGVADYLRD